MENSLFGEYPIFFNLTVNENFLKMYQDFRALCNPNPHHLLLAPTMRARSVLDRFLPQETENRTSTFFSVCHLIHWLHSIHHCAKMFAAHVSWFYTNVTYFNKRERLQEVPSICQLSSDGLLGARMDVSRNKMDSSRQTKIIRCGSSWLNGQRCVCTAGVCPGSSLDLALQGTATVQTWFRCCMSSFFFK